MTEKNFSDAVEHQEFIGGSLFLESDFSKEYITEFHRRPTSDREDYDATGKTGEQILIEVKSYNNPEFYRPYGKYNTGDTDNGYQIDEDKIFDLCLTAKEENRIPVLFVNFSDMEVAWIPNLKDSWSRKKYIRTNDKGLDYGKSKSKSNQTYLYLDEAVWTKKKNNEYKN